MCSQGVGREAAPLLTADLSRVAAEVQRNPKSPKKTVRIVRRRTRTSQLSPTYSANRTRLEATKDNVNSSPLLYQHMMLVRAQVWVGVDCDDLASHAAKATLLPDTRWFTLLPEQFVVD